MVENTERDPELPDTPDPSHFPIGSAESRAAMRLVLESGGTPHIESYFVEPGEVSEYFPSGAPKRCESVRAEVRGGDLPDANYERREGETSAVFEKRVWDDLPALGQMRVVTFFPLEDKPA